MIADDMLGHMYVPEILLAYAELSRLTIQNGKPAALLV